jgi:hypothetical protein
VVGLVEMMDDADLDALEAAAERGAVIGDRSVGAGRVARVVAGERLEHDRAILGGPCHRADMVKGERRRRDAGAVHETVGRLQPGDAAVRCGAVVAGSLICTGMASSSAGENANTAQLRWHPATLTAS